VDDAALTAAVHRRWGQDLADLGHHVDLAPSVDVKTAADNSGHRDQVVRLGPGPGGPARRRAVRGLQRGVAACAKHFSGTAATARFPPRHRDLQASLPAPPPDLRRSSRPIAAGVRGVMPGHLRCQNYRDAPATLASAAALNGLLEGGMGLSGW